jgi:hypothetical protein
MAHGRAQHAGGIEHAGDVPDGQDLAGLLVADVLGLQDFTHRLRDRQIARRQQHHEAVARLLVDHHLAERADLVQSGIGAGVGQKHEPGVEFDGDAIGHGGKVKRRKAQV